MNDWPDNWSVLKEEILRSSGSEIFERMPYRELCYYESAMNNGALETNLYLFEIEGIQADGGAEEIPRWELMDEEELESFIRDSNIDEIQKAFSTAGNNIWEVLDYIPRMRIGQVEDSDHIYSEFWIKNSEDTKYHPREGRDITFPNIGKAYTRIRLEDKVAEVRERGMTEDNISTIQTTLEEMFSDQISFTGENV